MVNNTKAYIDVKKLETMSKTETWNTKEVSEEWENFENETINFATRCKSFFDRVVSLK